MLKKDIAVIAIRLLALYVIVLTVFTLPGYMSAAGSNFFDDQTGRAVLLYGIIGLFLNLSIGVALWFYSPSIAELITKGLDKTSQSSEEFKLENVQVVAFSLAGLFILSSAIPEFIGLLVSYLFPETNPRYSQIVSVMGSVKAEIPLIDIVKVGVRLGLGFWFLLGAKGIVAMVRGVWAKGKHAW